MRKFRLFLLRVCCLFIFKKKNRHMFINEYRESLRERINRLQNCVDMRYNYSDMFNYYGQFTPNVDKVLY
jgi:hypothetical protein